MAWLWLVMGCDIAGDVVRIAGPPPRGSVPAATAPPLAERGPLESEVRVLALQGRTLELTEFAEATGCTVTMSTARTSYELMTQVHLETHDLILATTDVTRRLIRDDVLQPINPALLPSWSAIPTRHTEAASNRIDSRPFGVPLQWGPVVLMYVADRFATAPTSWRVIYEATELADGGSTTGLVQDYGDAIGLARAALTLRDNRPTLGIRDPYALTRDQFRQVTAAVRNGRTVIGRYWQDPDQQVADFLAGRAVLASSWIYQARALTEAGLNVGWTIPSEGSTAWGITALIPRDAPHPSCAYALAEHLITVDGQQATAQAWASVPVRPDACEDREETEFGAAQCTAYGADRLPELDPWRTAERPCGQPEDCVAHHEWIAQHLLARGGL